MASCRWRCSPPYGDGAAAAESEIVQAIAAGEVDGGWPTVRAFANAGIPGLQAVEAPMTITSYDAEKELVSGPVADERAQAAWTGPVCRVGSGGRTVAATVRRR